MIYYNDNEPFVAQWLLNLVAAEHITRGEVDDRDMREIDPASLHGFRRWHLCAGIGGFELGAMWAGWPDDATLLTAGFPCQPFSVAGQQQGIADDRYLWPVVLGFVRALRPEYVLLENVPAIDGRKHMVLDRVLSDLEESGYSAGPLEIPACAVDAPHIRNRVWIVAHASSAELPDRDAEPRGWSPADAERLRHTISMADRHDPRLAQRQGERGHDGQECPAAKRSGDVGDDQSIGWGEGRAEPGVWGRRSAVASAGSASQEWIACGDGKLRRVKPGVRLLAHGLSGRMAVVRTVKQGGAEVQETHWYSRVGSIKALGNAIVPKVAAEVLRAMITWGDG